MLYTAVVVVLILMAFAVLCCVIRGSEMEKASRDAQFKQALDNCIEVQDANGKWRRVPAYQVNEFLTDDQIAKLRELQEWMVAQNPQSAEEVQRVEAEFRRRRKELMVITNDKGDVL